MIGAKHSNENEVRRRKITTTTTRKKTDRVQRETNHVNNIKLCSRNEYVSYFTLPFWISPSLSLSLSLSISLSDASLRNTRTQFTSIAVWFCEFSFKCCICFAAALPSSLGRSYASFSHIYHKSVYMDWPAICKNYNAKYGFDDAVWSWMCAKL